MSKQDQAGLILKLYELRREEVMRAGRDWYFREFHPESMQDVMGATMGPHSGHMRMVASYWDMAAALVNHGAIDIELFNDTNGEHFGVFAKVELFLEEIRSTIGAPYFMKNLEKLIDATPGGRERCVAVRERMKAMREKLAAQKAATE
ncbi:MAG: hypothetical protein SGI92_12605 [Bryobacteraceae bacterium]|nr:hypothetical protein [Bryobacteraceae bacterium]